jgi:hypothetical protein
MWKAQAARQSRPITPARGRRLVGLEQNLVLNNKLHPDYSEF